MALGAAEVLQLKLVSELSVFGSIMRLPAKCCCCCCCCALHARRTGGVTVLMALEMIKVLILLFAILDTKSAEFIWDGRLREPTHSSRRGDTHGTCRRLKHPPTCSQYCHHPVHQVHICVIAHGFCIIAFELLPPVLNRFVPLLFLFRFVSCSSFGTLTKTLACVPQRYVPISCFVCR